MGKKLVRMFLLGFVVGIVIMGSIGVGVFLEKSRIKIDDSSKLTREFVNEESVVTKVVQEATPSVVTVSISKTQVVTYNPFFGNDFFSQFFGIPSQNQQETKKIEQDIGTGFIISSDGLIVTNKHVVADLEAKYKVIIGKDEVAEVKNVYRDPLNDLAILKVERNDLKPVLMGDSDKIKVGQSVIAIGTALGEFRSTVTTGVISGVGRGITAGSPFEGSERLENVIQTDAAINPGNSGGPLFNSFGEVIGVNVAVSQSGQNIGFALPINIVKESIENFRTTGEFERPYLGVAYQMITKQAALLNEVPQGAYVQDVVKDGPADKSGIKQGDIILQIDGKKLNDEKNSSVVTIINKKKIGDEVEVKVWRDKEELMLRIKLEKRV
jgi:serine protease Do